MGDSIEEKIKEIEEEIADTDYNKATQQHIGRLKAKLARLKTEREKRQSAGGGVGYAVKKSGNATVGLIGLPSVGKSTLLNALTDAESEVGQYEFTTLKVIPGTMSYKGAKIHLLDLPGLIEDASKGKGRGREVLSAVRSADLVLIVIDPFHSDLPLVVKELEKSGLRLNQSPPDVVVNRKERGGIDIMTTVELTKMDKRTARAIVREYGHINADVIIREDISEDRLIDALVENRVYTDALVVLNKIDLVDKNHLDSILGEMEKWTVVPVSARTTEGLESLKDRIFDSLDLIRVYMKPQGEEADLDEPLVIRRGSTIGDVCDHLHRTFRPNFRYAWVWGESAKFPGQKVGLDHQVQDEDVITVVINRRTAR